MGKPIVSTPVTVGPLGWDGTLIEGDLAAEVARLGEEHRGDLLFGGQRVRLASTTISSGVVLQSYRPVL